jgi:hypothetical protein
MLHTMAGSKPSGFLKTNRTAGNKVTSEMFSLGAEGTTHFFSHTDKKPANTARGENGWRA